MHSVALGCIFDGDNRRPPVIRCCGRWLNTTDSVNTDHSDGTKMERWLNGNVTHSANRSLLSIYIYLLLLLLPLQPTVDFSLLSDFLPFRPFSTLLFPSSGCLPQRLQSIFSLVFLWFLYWAKDIYIYICKCLLAVQKSKNFPKIQEPPTNSKRQKEYPHFWRGIWTPPFHSGFC